MELRQLKYFVKVVEAGSLGRAAQELGVVTSALSQQLSRLESELSARLLMRGPAGVTPTQAGLAFLNEARIILRHAARAVDAAGQNRLAGAVRVALAPTTAAVVAMPLLNAARQRYPGLELHIIEALSGDIERLLTAREVEIGILFQPTAQGFPLLRESLFAMERSAGASLPAGRRLQLTALRNRPLILPSARHGLRRTLDTAFERAGFQPRLVLEIDGLHTLLAAVAAGVGITVQPGAALAGGAASELRKIELVERGLFRRNFLTSLPEEELSSAALAARALVREVAQDLVNSKCWPGATLHKN